MNKIINKLKEAVQIPFSVNDLSYQLPDYMKTEQLQDLSRILLDELDYGFFTNIEFELKSEFECLFNDMKSYNIFIPLVFESCTLLSIRVFDIENDIEEIHRMFILRKRNELSTEITYVIPMEFIDVDNNLISIS